MDTMLFLVHQGKVALYNSLPTGSQSWGPPVAIYPHGWFLNRQFLLNKPTEHFAVAATDVELVAWDRYDWWRMCKECPMMGNEIMEGAMKQLARDSQAAPPPKEMSTLDEKDLEEQEDKKWYIVDTDVESLEKAREGLSYCRSMDEEDTDPELEGRGPCWGDTVEGVQAAPGWVRVGDQFLPEKVMIHHPDDPLWVRWVQVLHAENDPALPQTLMIRLRGVELARNLGTFKLFDPMESLEGTVLPELPPLFQRDLVLAFHTYATDGFIEWSMVPRALMYAGIFGTPLMDGQHPPLSEAEFLAVGHEATMARLTQTHIEQLQEVFNAHDFDNSGELDLAELSEIFRKTFRQHLSIEDLDVLLAECDENNDGQVSTQEFISLMSRMVRKHMNDWELLQGMQHVLESSAAAKGGEAEARTKFRRLSSIREDHGLDAALKPEAVEEMLWATDCELRGKDKPMTFRDFAASLLVGPVVPVKEHLPPHPREPTGEPSTGKEKVDVTDLVIDRRISPHAKEQALGNLSIVDKQDKRTYRHGHTCNLGEVSLVEDKVQGEVAH